MQENLFSAAGKNDDSERHLGPATQQLLLRMKAGAHRLPKIKGVSKRVINETEMDELVALHKKQKTEEKTPAQVIKEEAPEEGASRQGACQDTQSSAATEKSNE